MCLLANMQVNAGETIYAKYKNSILKIHDNGYNIPK